MVLGGGILPLGDIWQCLETLWLSQCVWEERDRGGVGGREGAAGI